MIKYNLHTHSFYCGHGKGTMEEYARAGFENGLEILGFSEHLPFPDGRLSSSRMDYSEKKEYEHDVLVEKERYEGKMKVCLSWECDYFPDMDGYYQQLKEETDYLIVGTHFLQKDGGYQSLFSSKYKLTKEDLKCYADSTIKAISSGYFDFLAHPDVFFLNYENFDSEAKAVSIAILDAAEDVGIPIEANGNGLVRPSRFPRPGYPLLEFWQLARERKITFVRNTDAHVVENLTKSIPMLEEFASRVGIKYAYPVSLNPLAFKTE